jgi:hypothetical protein
MEHATSNAAGLRPIGYIKVGVNVRDSWCECGLFGRVLAL